MWEGRESVCGRVGRVGRMLDELFYKAAQDQ